VNRGAVFTTSAGGAEGGRRGTRRTGRPGRRETLLLVEDQPQVRRSSRTAWLRSYGYAYWQAADAEERIAQCAEHRERIDLLVTDRMNARMGGVALSARCAVASEDEGALHLRVRRSGVLEVGAHHLCKPLQPAVAGAKNPRGAWRAHPPLTRQG